MNSSKKNLLEILEGNEDLSQREIARLSGFSLGKVNLLIKEYVKKGMIEVKKLNAKKMKYILTPKGMTHLTRKTLNYLKRSYNEISLLNYKIRQLILLKRDENKEFFIYGKKDEIHSIIITVLNKIGVGYTTIHSIDKSNFDPNQQFIVLYWDPDFIYKVKKSRKHNKNVEFVNILSL